MTLHSHMFTRKNYPRLFSKFKTHHFQALVGKIMKYELSRNTTLTVKRKTYPFPQNESHPSTKRNNDSPCHGQMIDSRGEKIYIKKRNDSLFKFQRRSIFFLCRRNVPVLFPFVICRFALFARKTVRSVERESLWQVFFY